jgi:hypothetical protein
VTWSSADPIGEIEKPLAEGISWPMPELARVEIAVPALPDQEKGKVMPFPEGLDEAVAEKPEPNPIQDRTLNEDG